MVMIWRLKTLDLAKYMSRSVSARTVLETGLLTASDGVSLSGSGRWKTASWHLFNKVGRLVNQPSHSLTQSLLTPTARHTRHVAWPDVVFGEVARHGMAAGGKCIDACLEAEGFEGSGAVTADRCLAVFQLLQNGYMSDWRVADRYCLIREFSDADTFFLHVSDVTCNPADAAHADDAVSTPERRATQASSGWRSGRTSAEVSGAEQSSSNEMQAEEKSMGDVIRKESWRAHSDQHAASGTK